MEPVRDLELYRGLEEKLGSPVATALMDRLPPPPADQLVTKTDLTNGLAELRAGLKGDLAGLQAEQKGDIAELRAEQKGDLATLEQRMVGGFELVDERFATLHEELRATKHELISTMRGETIAAIHSQGRLMAFTLIGALVGLSVLAFAIAGLAA